MDIQPKSLSLARPMVPGATAPAAARPSDVGPRSTVTEPEPAWDAIDEASLESFPCSDAPAWTAPRRPAPPEER